ncbi:hypothetical protein M885DRAFT_105083 [Pelagophyceae sp. CCMP2097]|nr:hypothetical protein M885DRAFT_105083 [Pelagophyceae sp. CCMP2097]
MNQDINEHLCNLPCPECRRSAARRAAVPKVPKVPPSSAVEDIPGPKGQEQRLLRRAGCRHREAHREQAGYSSTTLRVFSGPCEGPPRFAAGNAAGLKCRPTAAGGVLSGPRLLPLPMISEDHVARPCASDKSPASCCGHRSTARGWRRRAASP